MANGQPRPAFYVAVLLVVLGLVGLALYRYGAIGPGGQGGQFSSDELKQMQKGAEAPDSSGITTVKEYNYVAATRLPEVKGISNYNPMADRTVRFAINVCGLCGTNVPIGASINPDIETVCDKGIDDVRHDIVRQRPLVDYRKVGKHDHAAVECR